MAATSSKIEWTESTWSPTTGCTKVSPGCANCYAETLTKRYAGRPGWPEKFERWIPGNDTVVVHPNRLELPLRWKKPRRVFVDSMSDLFHEDVPDEYIDRVFAVMALTPQHTYQVLTKRPARMRGYLTKQWMTIEKATLDGGPYPEAYNRVTDAYLEALKTDSWLTKDPSLLAHVLNAASDWQEEHYPEGAGMIRCWPLPNVWLGVTVENQHFAHERIPLLLDTPAAVRFLSCEPLLEPIEIDGYMMTWAGDNEDASLIPYARPPIQWVIVGGESGSGHRPFDPDWARSIVAQCREAGVSVFMKQMGGHHPGSKLEDLPEDLRVREFPL